MLKIESNLKINGVHWGLAFVDGISYTANASLAAKLLLKGYVVTDLPVAGDSNVIQTAFTTPAPVQEKTALLPEAKLPAISLAESPKPKLIKSRKKAVTADAADER